MENIVDLNLPDYLTILYMCRQIDQGNIPNLNVWLTADNKLRGFGWDGTPEGWHFWNRLLVKKDLISFDGLIKESKKAIQLAKERKPPYDTVLDSYFLKIKESSLYPIY